MGKRGVDLNLFNDGGCGTFLLGIPVAKIDINNEISPSSTKFQRNHTASLPATQGYPVS
jgi:hypothetical protein